MKVQSLPRISKKWLDAVQKAARYEIPVLGDINKRLSSDADRKDLASLNNVGKESRSERRAAILVPIVHHPKTHEPSFLFTLRSNKVSTHKGQVSFPGGHVDRNESFEQTAVREFLEECGVGIKDVMVLGKMQTIPALTGTKVTPVLGYVPSLDGLNPCKDEVEKVFYRSFRELDIMRRIEVHTYKGIKFNMPVFGDNGDDERIWGLSGWVTDASLRFLKSISNENENEN
jgi:8-oxo-dGTP pyrophosphatase MutT (NUDIX family)